MQAPRCPKSLATCLKKRVHRMGLSHAFRRSLERAAARECHGARHRYFLCIVIGCVWRCAQRRKPFRQQEGTCVQHLAPRDATCLINIATTQSCTIKACVSRKWVTIRTTGINGDLAWPPKAAAYNRSRPQLVAASRSRNIRRGMRPVIWPAYTSLVMATKGAGGPIVHANFDLCTSRPSNEKVSRNSQCSQLFWP